MQIKNKFCYILHDHSYKELLQDIFRETKVTYISCRIPPKYKKSTFTIFGKIFRRHIYFTKKYTIISVFNWAKHIVDITVVDDTAYITNIDIHTYDE